MVDFIEYVVAELKSKRLSKTNAAALVRQFSRRASIPPPALAPVIHPLLHRNTSDLSGQCYRSSFDGGEFFLADHQVKTSGHPGRKVLPAVAYLEMVRVALDQALPARPAAALLELHDTVWAQPIVVDGKKQVSIVLFANDNNQIDYEICSEDAEREVVHCQGRALFVTQPPPVRLDLDQLEKRMRQGQLAPDVVYATCARMGLAYGPAFRSINVITRGSGELLAHLRLPAVVAESSVDYVLHPSLMDGALQAVVGLLEVGAESAQARVPFALERLRIVSPCVTEMVAWVRYAAGSTATDNVVKLDIDLCNALGNVCVQMHGFSSRILTQEIEPDAPRKGAHRSLLAVPVWKTSGGELPAEGTGAEYAEHHVILCELAEIDVIKLAALMPHCRLLSLQSSQATIARQYADHAVTCFEWIQEILGNKSSERALLQIVVPREQEQALFAGLSGLLKTAALENPRIAGQLILVTVNTTAEELGQQLQAERLSASESMVRYDSGRQVLRWQEIPWNQDKAPVALREDGVYLITGGLGGLGALFAKEILAHTGRSRVVLTGRSALSAEKQARLDELWEEPGRLTYRKVDLGDADQIRQLVAEIKDEYGHLSGILHSAGMIADNFILKKSSAEFREVLAPKVSGTFNLDQASRDVELDFFVLFSAIAGALGNPGQSDYAAANSFMDQFAAYRNRQVDAKLRRGRTLSIDWPLWQTGGMAIDPASEEMLQRTTGMHPMRTATGMDAFHRGLALACDQLLVVEGDLAQIRRTLLSVPAPAPGPRAEPVAVASAMDQQHLVEKTEEYLRRQLSGLLKLPAHEIDPRAALENYGIDSILAMKLTNQLEKTFGSLSKTLFFEYQTIRELTDYFVSRHSPQLTALLAPSNGGPTETEPGTAARPPAPAKLVPSRRFSRQQRTATGSVTDAGPIAIIGLSGRYPESPDIAAYWENLLEGKDCIVEVPKERWDWREYFSEDRSKSGHHYSKWGGFIDGVDEFDPLFFNISPADAEYIDPQERLFLQHAWMAIEDAGYTRAGLQVPYERDLPGQVGVYVGVMYTEYQLFGAEATARGRRLGIIGSAASISNRVSYALNLHGPSMTLDTMCSSSLTAIHIACQDLKQGRTSLAIAGGVNVTIHPNKYLVLSAGQFISGDGHCQSFGEGGDGYIPGEGVGAVVLKRLAEAKRDGDHIYGIIRGSALTHGGKTNGYSVPNPQAQTSAISRALSEARIDPRHISYIEAHGTGTKLGDPVEIAALSNAFRQYTQDTEFCRIGSVKSNIGHCESAAGIAGFTKILLQMQHQQIVPSLHSAQLNPHIDFPRSPFVVNQSTMTWEQPVIDGRQLPRIAGISSFGAGGSNAHILIEEYQPPVGLPLSFANVVILLTAKTQEQLRQRALDLLAFIRPRQDTIDLVAMAYTLQVGREAMEERLGIVVSSIEQLVDRLQSWAAGGQGIEDVYQGQAKRNSETLSLFGSDADLRQTVDKWVAHQKLAKLLGLWVKGLEVDWSTLYGETKPPRVSLPVYPFAKERYWIDIAAGMPIAATNEASFLHPLLHCNTSDFSEQRYSSMFSGEEFFLADHQVKAADDTSQKVLPGVAYLEMARAAIEQALPAQSESTSVVELVNTVWVRPIVVQENQQVSIALIPQDHGQIDYEIYTQDGEAKIIHCQGRAIVQQQSPTAPLDLEILELEMAEGVWEASRVYAACARLGLVYGPSFRGITAVHQGNNQLLAHLRLPAAVEASAASYVLHPSLMDGALQAAVGLIDDSPAQSSQARLPFALDTLRIVSPCTTEMVAWLRYAPGSRAGDPVVKLDIDLCDQRGNVCVQMRGFSSRLASSASHPAAGTLLATPVWMAREVSEAGQSADVEHHVILCELTNVDAQSLESLLPHGQCLPLTAEAGGTLARRYSDYAVACFEQVKALMQNARQERTLVQLVVADHGELAILSGLSGLLKTAALENPRLTGQLLLVPLSTTTAELSRILRAEKSNARSVLVRYEDGARQILEWQEVSVEEEKAPIAFKESGVYLITGGLGGLGLLFAREILEKTGEARVLLTGRSALNAGMQSRLDSLSAQPGRVSYRQLDLNDLDQVKHLMAAVLYDYRQLDGVLHSAGMIADGFILKKDSAALRDVLMPKVAGTFNLDQASRLVELDFFVLFSSVAGALGNPGQSDYAAANGFLDQFAAYRNRQVAAGQRHGRTRSINWPLWQAGGMGIDPASQDLLQETTGIQSMQTATGMEAFHRILALPHDQVLVVEGDLARIRRGLLGAPAPPAASRADLASATPAIDTESLAEKTQDYLRRQLSGLLKMPFHKIDPHAALEQYGIDSVLAMKLTNTLEKTFGSLSKTLFFEYQTIRDLAEYFVERHATQLMALLAPSAGDVETMRAAALPTPIAATKRLSIRRFTSMANAASGAIAETDSIAIIGLSGRYPASPDLQTYWENLRQGKDCITEVPKDRWDWREYFSEDRSKAGHHYSKWGGFIDGVDEFDPLFFNMSPLEAELVDPQERLFLQHAWLAMEDAAYTRANLQVSDSQDLAGQVGVYVGVMYSEYQLFGAEASMRGKRLGVPGSPASIANRVSYAFNLHGPSMTLDTMCSSSLTAIHVACLDLKLGRTSLAIAGGVNVTVHPNKYLVLSAGQFISSDGHCQSFGEGGDGYIPGEGVGVVVLKRLSDAKRDGDHIYGVIRGSALNHGGKTNGYTVPNPQAQTGAIRRALAESRTDPRHISYIEAHGTGTKLGDPIEIAALSKAFHAQTEDTEFCLIGSVKSNIGHCESAAGIAGLTKVLLQMQHQQIVPSLHSTKLNPHIDFHVTPFTVNQSLTPWEQPVIDGRTLPRIAGISSFGAGGSNAHIIVEEYQQPVREAASVSELVIVLSARTPEQLRQRAGDLLAFLQPRLESIDLAAVAYTLQVGREAMEERLGFVVSTAGKLADSLRAWLAGEQEIEDAYQGRVIRSNIALSLLSTDLDLRQAMDKWIANRKLTRLLELWTYGMDLDWSGLYGEEKPSRVSLPTYPFARERYWIDTAASGSVSAGTVSTAFLHPLLHSNTSDLREQRYSSTFTGAEFFLADHQVLVKGHAAQKVLPGVAQLEMARSAVEHASPADSETMVVELRNVVWAEPVIVAGRKQVSIALVANGDDEIDYEIYSQDAEREIVHGQGRAILGRRPVPAPIDLDQLMGEMHLGAMEPAAVYAACTRQGLLYGSSFQGITAIHRGSDQLLAWLRLPKSVAETSGDFVLHPSMMDSAVHACVGLIEDFAEAAGLPRVPFALDSLRMLSPCTAEMVAWVRYPRGSQAGNSVVKLDIDLCDERGNVCVQMHGLSSRAMNNEIGSPAAVESFGSLLAVPVWHTSSVEASAERDFAEHHVIVCELSDVEARKLVSAAAGSECLFLHAEPRKTIAERYSEYAVACFDRIQTVLRSQPPGKVLLQIAVPDHEEQALFAGLSGLLKTAALENPMLVGQLLLLPAGVTAGELAGYLRDEKALGLEPLVRYDQGNRQVIVWQDAAGDRGHSPIVLKNNGIYLLTGGLGGLGVLFAREILERTSGARVVLTGRSELTAEKQTLLDALSARGGRVSYRTLDLTDPEDVRRVIAAVADEYHELNGILHAAGMIADRFILKKSAAEFSHVLAPKVTGAFNLDQASQGVELDFFVLFSSVAGALGNPGQADYAAANGFLDQFAVYRNRQVASGRRRGRTLSINWPLWRDGGMGIDPAGLELLQQSTGMLPMQTATGMQAFYRGLSLPYDQILVAEGDLAKMRRLLDAGRATPPQPSSRHTASIVSTGPTADSGTGSGSLAEKTQEYLRRQFADLLKLPVHKIDPGAELEKYGIDSILAMKLTNQLEMTFGSLSKTLFYEYQTIAGLAGYFVKAYPAIVRESVAFLDEKPAAAAGSSAVIEVKQPAPARRGKGRLVSPRTTHPQEIAIVGLAGRYPQAGTLQEFWRNLQNGRDCITEIPSERWDHSLYFDPDPDKRGKSYSKWGGFIDDVDKFDPLFFNISPKEAAMLDPQERLFLETAWQTVEDAGYTKENIAAGRVGVYVGVMWGHYQLFGAESMLGGNASLASSSYASIANRVSYFFNFHGPSIALDTMCSSSITAIHLACNALRKGEIDAAIAGGVNVSIHPYKYVSLSQGKFTASDGRCRSFGAGGDGYVPGEGVGAVLLKPVEHALRDRDQIYAVIKSSAINHGGKTNGYTVPSPNAQGDVVADALRKANIDPGTLSYIETHGTGTSLGDPIEITGLLKAFEGSSEEKQFCPIGSVKSNIGHLESAAGIASVTKALLQLKFQQLVPSLHADPLNPNINFENSPFYVQTELAQWKGTGVLPRRVGVSSFGAGGSNAHLILEEYPEVREQPGTSRTTSPEAFVLSAKNPDALRRYAESVVFFLGDASGLSLADIAYTSQVGRTPMDARLAIIASSMEDLREKLRQWAAGDDVSEPHDVFYANIREAQSIVGSLIAGPAGSAFIEALVAERDLERIARLWVSGACAAWPLMPRRSGTRRVSLPTYPFAKERYWIDQEAPALRVMQPVTTSALKVVAPKPAEKKRRTYYYPQWTPKVLSARTEAEAATGPTLILDTTDGLFLAMREQQEGAPFVLVIPGKSFQEGAPNVYTVDLDREEQFLELIAKLRSTGMLPRVILHHAVDACDLQVRDEVARRLNGGLYALFHLCNALIRESHQGPLKVVSVFSAGSEAAAPLDAAIGGFFRTLTLEEPMCLAKAIEVDREIPLSAKCGFIRDELCDQEWTDQEIRLRSDSRYVRGLVAHTPESRLSTLPLRQNGVYLITGGLGGLGIIFGKHLAKNYQARLVLVGRSAPNAAQEEKLEQLRSDGTEILVLQADTSRLDEMEMVVREAKARFSEIHGVIHAAGVTRDAFLLRKTREEIDAVLAPKVYGTINVDLATGDENLDFLVLFSSVAGVMGNVGQSDYAYANHFLDSFAETRARKRSGRTLSINWPLWEEGGMGISSEDAARLEKQTGVCPLPVADGVQYWEDFLRSDATQGVALYGIESRIAASIARQPLKFHRNAPPLTERVDGAALLAKTEAHLKVVIGEEINLAPDRIGSSDPLESFGLDSIVINRINAQLERDLGALPKTLLYEHETVRDLAAFLVKETTEALSSLFGGELPGGEAIPQAREREQDDAVQAVVSRAGERDDREPIAIIGIHGIYPHSANLAEYWENLKQGKDLIDLVPANRWDYEAFYHPDPAAAAEGKIYCKWGGFLDGHDKFDPHFFKIPTAEAGLIDPQERMFLESVWAAVEDAGYTRDSLRAHYPKAGSADVGVFVGVTTNSYHLWASEERTRGSFVSPTALPWSIANRVSYFFDFSGPSLPIDTACSSSLVAIHLACESLRNLDCQIAIAGGVNLYLHPEKYHSLCQKRMLSVDGKCHSYGAGDDGFVPGEGVGTLVLKRLSKAIEDQDRIHAVIRASAFDHSGRSNGYSAPNPNAQANLISQTLEKAGIHPETIGYVEGHGTGTQLGDSIEIAALTKAFQKETAKKQFCPIGSVKANIGHSESAAGVAGIAKVMLQMEHRQLAPSIYSDTVNPNIEFDDSPFYLQHGLSVWQSSPAHPRRALVNSFGAGGVNACVVVEEYEKPAVSLDVRQDDGPWLFTLSARNEDRLRDYAGLLLTRLRTGPPVDVADLCYTLQTGREAMEERLAIVVSDTNALIDRLGGWAEGSAAEIQRGSLAPRRGSRRSLKLVRTGESEHGLLELATKWVAGEDVDWESLYATAKPRRIGVPTYPFARERYWFSDSPVSHRPVLTIAHLHPLIAYNSSTLKEVNFRSSLPDTAFYAVDHQVHDERIFPGAGFLEIACIAANMAGDQRVRKITDIVWMRPLSFRTGPQALRTVLRHTHDSVEYVISSRDEENEEIVHSEGRLVFGNVTSAAAGTEDRTPPEELKALCTKPEDGAAFYDRFRSLGLHYGPSFRTIQELYVNDMFALAKLKIPDHLKGEYGQFILHPSIIDGALQSMAGLVGALAQPTLCLPFALDEIEIIGPIPQMCFAHVERADPHAPIHAGVTKFNIRILNERGEALIKFRSLYVRPLAEPQSGSHSAAAQPGRKGRLLNLSAGASE